MSSPDEAERRVAQEQLVAVYFEHLADYRAAIVEINRLISLPLPASKQRQYRLQLARSYFYLNNYVQARAELDTLGADLGGEEEPFEVTLLRANVAMAMKQTGKAEAIYKALLEKYPERSREENILTNLTLILEEEKRFEEAIAALEKFRTPSSGDVELLDLRIKRLRARLAKQPGAQGLKK